MIKEFNTWLIVDYRTGKFRVAHRQPRNMKGTEIPIDFKLNVEVADPVTLKAEGSIKLNETKATEIMISQVEGI